MTTVTSARPLWDPVSGRFDTARLRYELAVRAWVPDDVAREAGVSRTTMYKTLDGRGVRDSVAIKILAALQRREPVLSSFV